MFYIYVIGNGSDHVKVGVTADLDSRLRSLQTGSSTKLSIEFSMTVQSSRAAYKIESIAHAVLAHHRTEGEWFSCPPSVAMAVVSEAVVEYAANEYGCTGLHDGGEVSLCAKSSRYIKEMCLKTGLPKTHIIDEAIIEYYGAVLGYKRNPVAPTAGSQVRARILETLSAAGPDGISISLLKRAKGVSANGVDIFDEEMESLAKSNAIHVAKSGRGTTVYLAQNVA